MRLPILLVAALLSVACKSKQPVEQQSEAEAAKPSSEPERASPKVALRVSMTEHFTQAEALEQAVIDGDLDQVQVHARWLVDELPAASLPKPWQPSLARMQSAAREAAEAQDLATAAAATGKVIEACGACHAALGTGPIFTEVTPVPEGETSQARMQRHQWAAERMREGMIGPSDERWQLGASAVSVAPPEPCPIKDADILPADVLQLREKIYDIGAKAARTKTAEERAQVYGEYLSTCAGCHTGAC